MAQPLNIRDAGVAAAIDLTLLAVELMGTPEPLYLWDECVSSKFGPKVPGQGSTVQIDRLEPLESPDPDNLSAYDTGTNVNALDTTNQANLQTLSFSKVTINVRRRRMPKPVAEKFETEQLSQVDLQMAHRINLKRNFNEFKDDFCREAIRTAICSNIFGGNLAASQDVMSSDPAVGGLTVAMLKEFKRRASVLNIRAFGSVPGDAKQALMGSYLAMTDQVGINELSEDDLWRNYVIRDPKGDLGRITKGFIGEHEQIVVVKSDRVRLTESGPTGDPFNAHEIIFMATDPTLIEPGDGNVQGFIGEYPICYTQLGMPEVKRASEDNFGEDLIFTWFLTCGIAATEKMSSTRASALTTLLGGGKWGTAATDSSTFIHRGLFA